MKFIGIIPARYTSTRFPGKPLVEIHGKSMIQRVYEQCVKAELDQVVVATDDSRIFEHIKSFGGEVIMTSDRHQSGTDRIAEAAEKLNLGSEAIVLNIQGDEPFINPEDIKLLGDCFTDEGTQIATLVKKIKDVDTLTNPNSPKVVLGIKKQALYFSREVIPHLRGYDKKDWLEQKDYFQHIGIYAFKHAILKEVSQLKSSPLEQSEGLEQLRWLENGYSIHTAEITSECIAVDSPEDLKRIDEKFFS
jgi:3-deoxy-manno-octulosonate cytidylyltransferase (CMP-KDO synthetase)